MIHPTVRALAVVCWMMCVRNTVSQYHTAFPAPTLSFVSSESVNNIVLDSEVWVTCKVPYNAPFPLTAFVGRQESPSQTPETTQAWSSGEINKFVSYVMNFGIPGVAFFEGKIVCWYKSTRADVKNPYSEFSNPVTFIISSLPSPVVTVAPGILLEGGNYTVQCNSTTKSATNFTISLFYRNFPAAYGTDWSLYYTGNSTNISLAQTNATIPMEYACSMEMLYNGKVLRSSLSKSQTAYPEKFQVRLWEKSRGETCLGFLEVKLQGNWEPVCKKEVSNIPDASSAAAIAKVVCRELRCGSALDWNRVEIKRSYARTVDVVGCTGDEKKFSDCQLTGAQSCQTRTLYITCSDALPPPTLSVKTYGSASNVYVKDKEDVEIFCSISSTYLNAYDSGYYIFKKDGSVLGRDYTYPNSTRSFTQASPNTKGQYECVFELYSSNIQSPPSNAVFIHIYNPPDLTAVVIGVLTTVIGVAILVYVCVYRTAKEEVNDNEQDNELPVQSMDAVIQTNAENPYCNVSLPQQM